ncbi:hypothetical protein Trydic_g7186 [Trypoxylus dichotomus]
MFIGRTQSLFAERFTSPRLVLITATHAISSWTNRNSTTLAKPAAERYLHLPEQIGLRVDSRRTVDSTWYVGAAAVDIPWTISVRNADSTFFLVTTEISGSS